MTLIKSKQRVADYGEVNTNLREINAMLDLVKNETLRIESKFLEPACGDGNFIIEVLRRKLQVVKDKYSKLQFDFEKNLFIATASVYGIELLEDNVLSCRKRLLDFLEVEYKKIFKKTFKDKFIKSLEYVLKKNILLGDALTLKSNNEDLIGLPIVFSDWSVISGGMVKRKDFVYSDLVDRSSHREMPLFSDLDDLDEAFIPDPIKDYPLIHYMDVMNHG
jgi:hypothetical protein